MTEDKRKGVRAGYEKLGPTARFMVQMTVAGVIFTIFGYLLGFLSSECYYARSQRAARHLSNITRSRPIPFVWKFPVVIEDGSNMQEISAPGRYHSAFGCPFSFFISQDGNINLRGVIRDAEGNIVIEGTGDSIRAIQTTSYDINSDDKAIEVVDADQRPVFQLTVISREDFIEERAQRRSKSNKLIYQKIAEAAGIDANMVLETIESQSDKVIMGEEIEEIIQISYIAKRGDKWRVHSPFGIIPVKSLEEGKRLLNTITRLFCYPGYAHPGKRVAITKPKRD